MSDSLENFIRKNREAFDDKTPREGAWTRIEESLPRGRHVSLWNSAPLWRTAAVVFMALSIYLVIPKHLPKSGAGNDTALRDFNDIEKFYVEQISEKVELIDEFQRHDGVEGFTNDFKQLEAMYAVLKEEMKAHPSKKVREALVLNLLVRIDLLNQQLHALEHDAEEGAREKEGSAKKTSV